jgi:hypothetical protein
MQHVALLVVPLSGQSLVMPVKVQQWVQWAVHCLGVQADRRKKERPVRIWPEVLLPVPLSGQSLVMPVGEQQRVHCSVVYGTECDGDKIIESKSNWLIGRSARCSGMEKF